MALTAADRKQLTKELKDVRRRGIRRVDLVAPGQPRIPAPVLESLADLYASLKGLEDEDRPVLFRELLWDGLQKYATKNGMADIATWVRDLFFWPDDPHRFVSPGDLLRDVKKRLEYSDRDSSFWRLRDHEFGEFAGYLVAFVNAEAERANERIKADRTQDMQRILKELTKQRDEEERLEAERANKEAKKQKERAKKESKDRAQAQEDDDGKSKTQKSRGPTSEQRKRQLAREKFVRQQRQRDKARAQARRRNSVIAAVLSVVIAGSVLLSHFNESLPQWLK